MIEIIPNRVDTAFLYFHTRCSTGDEIAPFVVLCGHQHGACVALAAAMLRREQPFALTVLFDPWPLETLYLGHEGNLPATKVACIDNRWVRERERQRGAETELYKVFQRYGMQAEGITLDEGQGQPDEYMFRGR